jgi:gliding motility-associated-like protein
MLNTCFISRKITLLHCLILFLLSYCGHAQIYYHDFGTSPITTHPYTAAPPIIDSHLSGSSWTNSVGSWTSNPGAGASTAITLLAAPGTNTITLTFNVASSYQLEVTSFNFWRQRSSIGPTNWTLSINGTNVGSGTTPTIGAAIGATNVSTPITGLTGTVTVTLTLTGGTAGNNRLDDFTLNGAVSSNCTAPVISSFSPVSAPANTIATITGSGFTNATAVKFNGVDAAAFTIISNTTIKVTVPVTATSGVITITANGCEGSSAGSFNFLTSACNNNFTEIFISELYDQESGSGGMIELYNPTAAPINLNGYTLQRFGNITDTTPTAGYILALTGTIGAGMTYLISGTTPNSSICAAPTASQNIGNGFNGNDKFELLKNGVVIDRVHVPFTGPGFTLIRKPAAIAPVTTYNINDWNNTQHPNDIPGVPNTFCQNLGLHTITPTPIPTITHPVSATVCENGTTTYIVNINPSAGFSYQWKVLNSAGIWVNITNNTNYSGATTNSLTLSQVPLSFDSNQYYCEIISSACTLYSNAAQLAVVLNPAIAAVTMTQPTCTTPTGTITINSPVGAGLTYSIDGTTFVTTSSFANLSPGTYTITVKNSNNCTSVNTPIVINTATGAPAVANVTLTQPTCTTPTGTITVNSPVGAGLTYSIDGTTFVTTTAFPNLNPGTYAITVNAGGCTSVTPTLTINPVPAAPAVANVTLTQPTCTTPTGTITINSPIGAGLTYSIDGTTFVTTTLFPNLNPGNYTITVKDAGACTSVTPTLTINPVPAAPAVANVTLIQPTCTTPTGTITVNSPVGVGLTYSIDGITFVTTTSFANLNPGTYTITVKDAGECTSVAPTLTINPVPAAPAVANVTLIQPTCTTPTGTITVNSPVGAGLTYSIDGTTFVTTTSFANLNPGTYTITVKDAGGCTSVTPTITIDPVPGAPAVANVTLTQPTCPTPTGTITITSPVGTGLTYSINGTTFVTTTSFPNLNPGTYTITVKDAGGCTSITPTITIDPVPAAPAVANTTLTQPTCPTPTGTITVNSPLGAGLTYSINGTTFVTTTSFPNLNPGTYTITVKDAGGCTAVTSPITINTVPAAPAVANVTLTQPTCSTPGGIITVNSPIGALLTYSIDGTTFVTTTSFPNLNPGTYTITVRDAGGCTSTTATLTINPIQPPPAVADVTVIQPGCTTPTGTITVNSPVVIGLTYSIDGTTFVATTSFPNLNPGTYTITIRDMGGCTSVSPAITIDPAPAGLPPIPQPAPIAMCDFNNDGFEYFDLTNVIQAIENSLSNITVTVHETPQNADNNVNAVPNVNQYPNVNQFRQTLYIRVASDTTDCFDIVTLQLIVNPVPEATTPSDYELCDDGASDTDGQSTFNLSTKAAEIYGSIDPALFSLAFYTTPVDAAAATNPIPNPLSYLSITRTVYARVTNNATGCFDVVALNLIVNPLPVLITNQYVYRLCETDDPAEIEIFDLTSTIPVFIADQNGVEVTYYHTFADANAHTNAIANPEAYQNTQPGAETLFVVFTFEATGCYRIGFLDVDVDPEPIILVPTQDELTVCDTNGQGIGEFDLAALVTDMENGEPGLVINFYETQQDALNGTNPIPNTSDYVNSVNPQFIYVGVTNTITGCSNNEPYMLTLIVEPAPQAPALEDLTFCDDTDNNGQDGRKLVDLTVQDAVIEAALGLDIPTQLIVEYYTTAAAAEAGTGRIINPSAFMGTDGQHIWVRVETPVTECYSVEDFFLHFNKPHVLTTPPVFARCNEALPNDGITTFDLTTRDDIILGPSGVSQGYTVNYYVGDPRNGGVLITDPTNYTNPAPPAGNPKTLYVEVITTDGCKSYTTLTVKVLALPVPNFNPTALEICDDTAPTGTEPFDLTDAAGDIQANGSNYILSYYESAADAEAATNAIADPTAYESGSGEVYVRVELDTHNPLEEKCHQVVTLELILNPLPPVTTLDNIAHCLQNSTGNDTFDLQQELNDILIQQGVDPQDFDVDFFTDAALTTPAIPVNAYPVTGGSATVYVRVVNIATGCQVVRELTLLVEEAAIANPVTTTFVECDYDGVNDGVISTWDLTLADADVLGSQDPATHQIRYFESPADITNNNPIANPTAYTNTVPGGQTIWVEIRNMATQSQCPDVTSFTITVERLPEPVITGGTICVDKATDAVVRPLEISTGLDATHTFQWFHDNALMDETGSSIIAQEEGSYTVIATSANGCVSDLSAPAVVIKSGSAVKVDRGYYVTNYFSDNQTITVTIDGYGVYEYSLDEGPWQPGNIFNNVSPGTHTVRVRDTNPDACEELVITGASIVDYPNFFTPNNDGYHDYWNIIGLQDTGSVIYIFDRYGKLLKQISPDSEGWDGKFNDVQVPADDYWFTVTYPEFNGTTTVTREFKSHFSLKR